MVGSDGRTLGMTHAEPRSGPRHRNARSLPLIALLPDVLSRASVGVCADGNQLLPRQRVNFHQALVKSIRISGIEPVVNRVL